MKFVDEATILVAAGKGGNGSCSFRREKFIPFGGPDGGDGGNGGSIYLQADSGLNTLIDFRYIREIKADSGMGGSGAQRSGRSGEDKVVLVPVGTMVKDEDGNFIGDLTKPGERLLVARGGQRGVGNLHFKSSTNRAPRQFTPGKPGEVRHIKLELKLLADVGLLGFPNAGKSTLISAVSAARPKVADYPFTTLIPNLGVVRIDSARSFVMADIPGIIEGAAEGAGLGLKFLKHLSRTRVLLHLVDILGLDDRQPEDAVAAIEQELLKYDENLATKPRWLVFNKIDCIDKEEQDEIVERTVKALNWQGPVFKVSAATGEGTAHLCQELMKFLPTQKTDEELQLEQEAIDARKMDDAFDAQFENIQLDEDEAVA